MKYLLLLCGLVAVAAIENCGTEVPSKVAGCEKVDENFCGTSCCGIEVHVRKDLPHKKINDVMLAFFKSTKGFGEASVDGEDSFTKILYTNERGGHNIEVSYFDEDPDPEDSNPIPIRKFFLASIAAYNDTDNGQNYKIVTDIVAKSLQAEFQDSVTFHIEYGCGVTQEDIESKDRAADAEMMKYLEEQNMTYEDFLKSTQSGSGEMDLSGMDLGSMEDWGSSELDMNDMSDEGDMSDEHDDGAWLDGSSESPSHEPHGQKTEL